MWVFTESGFLSIVENEHPRTPGDELLVRSRARADLDDLADYIQTLGGERPVVRCTPSFDYPFRLFTSRAAVAGYLTLHVQGINYPSFKDKVNEKNHGRATIYGGIWSMLRSLMDPRVAKRTT